MDEPELHAKCVRLVDEFLGLDKCPSACDSGCHVGFSYDWILRITWSSVKGMALSGSLGTAA